MSGYQPLRTAQSRFIDVRRLRYHLRTWGDPDAAVKLVMLHGWMDVSASFQFVVDHLPSDWFVIAPDWRGFGLTSWPQADCYWFPDYVGDLDAILDAALGAAPALLVGHSMGGNVALTYAGVRPERVRALVNLEGFGLRDSPPDKAPERLARWLDELRAGTSLRNYANLDEVAARLQRNNPRLSAERAQFLAAHWSEALPEGRYRVAGDPAHKIVNPVPYRFAEVAACWQRIVCPVLWVQGVQTEVLAQLGLVAEVEARRAQLPTAQFTQIEAAGHMLHHEQPAQTARCIEDFFTAVLARSTRLPARTLAE